MPTFSRNSFSVLLRIMSSAVLVSGLAACGPESTPAGAGATVGQTAGAGVEAVPGSSAQVERRIGEATVRAYAMQTSTIPESVAREHGIERAPDLIMLRVSGRQAGGSGVDAVPLRVDASVTDLHGRTEPLTFREVKVNGLIDYVATVQKALPVTLRFDMKVTTPDGTNQSLQLTRDFAPL